MAFVSLTLALLGLVGLLLYIFLVYNFNYWKKRGVLGPKPRPLLGNMPNILLQKQNFQCDISDIYRQYKGKDRFIGVFNMRQPQLLVIDPKLVQDILITSFKNFSDNEMADATNKDLDPMFGRNPFILSGNEWKEKRAEVTAALTNNRIKASYPIMQSVGAKMTKYIEKVRKISADGINAKDLSARFTTEVVANCVYGIEAGSFREEPCELRNMGSAILDLSSFSFIYQFLIAGLPTNIRNQLRRPFVKKELNDYFIHLMEQAIKIRKETKIDRIDFLNHLLQLQEKKGLSNLELTAHTLTFFLDGFETSSILISNCLRCLAQNDVVQERLRDEIRNTIDDSGEIAFEKLLEMPYLEQCINECLRLYPPALSNVKKCTIPCELTNSKDKRIQIEKGTPIILPYYALQNDPEYYNDPEVFIPERFNPENGGVKKYRDMGVFLPFGDGPRICLGMRFGLCQSKVAIVEIIRNWKITLNPKTNPKFVIDPKYFLCVPEGGTWLNFAVIDK